MLDDALAIYLTMWAILTFIFLLGTFRSSVALFLVFFFLEITFWLLAAGHYTRHITVTKAGGGMGVVTAFTAFYTALAGLREYFYFFIADLVQSPARPPGSLFPPATFRPSKGRTTYHCKLTALKLCNQLSQRFRWRSVGYLME